MKIRIILTKNGLETGTNIFYNLSEHRFYSNDDEDYTPAELMRYILEFDDEVYIEDDKLDIALKDYYIFN